MALISPRFEPKALGLAPARAFGRRCCLVGMCDSLGILHSFTRQRDRMCDCLPVPIRLIVGAAGSLKRQRPCPMCTALLSCLDGNADHIRQRIALAVVGLSPIERQIAFKVERGWKNLPLYADVNGNFSRDYHAIMDDGTDTAAENVFSRECAKWCTAAASSGKE